MIAGERPAAAVGAMHARCEADDQESRTGIAERQHRPGVVAGVLMAHFGQETGEART